MPKFSSTTEAPTTITPTFQFSPIALSSLGATEYTLVGIACDRSGSTSGFAREEETALKAVIEACRKSPRADNLLCRVTRFDNEIDEIHGFRLLQDIKPADYDGVLDARGTTALYDASVNAIASVTEQGRQLITNDYSANGIVIVVTDGCDYPGSKATVGEVAKAIVDAQRSECLESIVTILIGVNVADQHVARVLEQFSKGAGFSQFVPLADATPATLAKLAAFVSKSISSQSQALGTGGPSQAITF